MCNISINKKQLNTYLEDFHPDKISTILSLFTDSDFDCGQFSFREKMKRKIAMPKFGKRTINYWLERGWSEQEALIRRTTNIKDPESSPMNINFWIKKGYSEYDANIQVKSNRKTNKEYWLKRGYTEEDSIKEVSRFQKENSLKFLDKKINDEDFRNDVMSKMPNRVEYWLNIGYSESEAKEKVSNRQSTFSLEKCIEKYGNEIGIDVWQKRQLKWRDSLNRSDYNGRDNKDSKSISFYKNKYKENWISEYIQLYKNIEDIRYLTSFKSYEDLILQLIYDRNKVSEIKRKILNPLVYEVYSISKTEINKFLSDNYKVNTGTIEYYKHLYGDKWVSKFINETYYKDKKDVLRMISYDNYQSLILDLVSEYSITEIILKIQNKIISNYYETTYEDMFNYLTNLNPYIESKFGRMRYFNNHLCRSDGEFLIANFLKDKNIEYKYEKVYYGTKMRCDFYLPYYDLYLEYTGMNTTEHIQKYKTKKELLSFRFNVIFSNDITYIKNEIQNYVIENNYRKIKST